MSYKPSKIFILTVLVASAPFMHSADAAKQLVLKEYENGENRYFHKDMSDCDRYNLYSQLCWNSPCNYTLTQPKGRKSLIEFMNSQPKTCQGVPINNTNFEKRNAILMTETIKEKQEQDLNAYYTMRAAYNPEKEYVNIRNNIELAPCSCFFGLAESLLEGRPQFALAYSLLLTCDQCCINLANL